MFKKILIPIDGSEGSEQAVEHGLKLLKSFTPNEVVLFYVAKFPAQLGTHTGKIGGAYHKIIENLKEYGNDILAEAQKKFLSEQPSVTVNTKIKWGDAAYDIVEEARKGDFDLIIIGSRGLEGIKSLLLGSVSSYVTRHAHCTVVVVRETEND